jgi:hypothetical protein
MDASDNDRGLWEPPGSDSMAVCSAMTENSSQMTGQSAAKRRILVVEDEMLIGMLLEHTNGSWPWVATIVPRLGCLAAVERET